MITELLAQLNEQRRKVDFDTYDITVKELLSMVSENLIDIAPEYQRQFRWDEERQSLFVESVFLGIPVPSLFTAANSDSTWEMIDGVQRLSTLIHFAGDEKCRSALSMDNTLKLVGLEKLSKFDNLMFEDLPSQIQTQFLLKPIKVTTITDKSDMDVRFDLFERLNTGGVILTNQEIRSCLYRGEFNEFLRRCAANKDFRTIVRLPKDRESDGTREEYILRLFSFLYDGDKFEHSVVGFLNNFMKTSSRSFDQETNQKLFETVCHQLAEALPNGIKRTRGTTPVNLFEAVAVGAALAIREMGTIMTDGITDWMISRELTALTTGPTNSKPMVLGRIYYCRDRFEGK